MGVSCFSLLSTTSNQLEQHNMTYLVQTFNILVLCQQDYVVEPGALSFLVAHGFDFNKQYSQGVPYYRGEDRVRYNNFIPYIYLLQPFGDE